jgi:hypothetical protein
MANEISITVSVNDDTGPGREKIVEGAAVAGEEAGNALAEGVQAGVERASGLIGGAGAGAGRGGGVGGAGAALAEEMAVGGEAAVVEAKSVQQQMAEVFQEIYQRGSNASFQLASAMTAAWADIDAETKGLTAKEKQTFSEFSQIMATEGRDAAVAFATGQREAAAAIVQTGSAAAQAAPAMTELATATQATWQQLGFMSEQAFNAYEETNRLWAAQREGITQFALFNEQDAPGMFARIAETAGPAAAEVQAVGVAAEESAGQLELFTMAELQWTETVGMAQRATQASMATSAGWPAPAGQPVWVGSEREASAANVKAMLEGDAQAADKAKESVGGLAGMMGGPLMNAVWLATGVVPMLTYMFQGQGQAAQQAAQQYQQLVQAIGQDSGAVGDNTAAIIQQTLAQSNLTALSQQLGLSQAQLIEYAAGEADVQKTVNAQYSAQADQLGQTAGVTREYGKAVVEVNNASQVQLNQLNASKGALDAVAGSVQKALVADRQNTEALTAAEQSTQIYSASVADLVAKQQLQAQQAKMNAEAQMKYINDVIPGTQAFADAVKVQQENLLNTGYQAGLTAVAMLNLGDSQFNLNNELDGSVNLYTRAATEANAYNTVLTSLAGNQQLLLGSEAAFTIALDGVAKAAQANGLSLDVNDAKGAQNIQTFTQLAQAADKAAVAVYQNEAQTKGSVTAYQDANTKLAQEKQAFIDNAEKAGFNKTAVQQLADQLYQLPADIETTVNVNTAPALSQLATLLETIDTSSGTVRVYENTASGQVINTGMLGRAQATGGIVGAAVGGPRGNLVMVGEQGPEYVRLPSGTSVIPHSNVNSMAAAGGGDGGCVQIELVTSGFEDMWMRALRHAIRVRGGNVQKVLGVN